MKQDFERRDLVWVVRYVSLSIIATVFVAATATRKEEDQRSKPVQNKVSTQHFI